MIYIAVKKDNNTNETVIRGQNLGGNARHNIFNQELNTEHHSKYIIRPNAQCIVKKHQIKTLVPIKGAALIYCYSNTEPIWTHDGYPLIADTGVLYAQHYIIILEFSAKYEGKYGCYDYGNSTLYYQESTWLISDYSKFHINYNYSNEKNIMRNIAYIFCNFYVCHPYEITQQYCLINSYYLIDYEY